MPVAHHRPPSGTRRPRERGSRNGSLLPGKPGSETDPPGDPFRQLRRLTVIGPRVPDAPSLLGRVLTATFRTVFGFLFADSSAAASARYRATPPSQVDRACPDVCL